MDEQKASSTEIAGPRQGDRQGKAHSYCCIYSVSAAAEYLYSHLRGFGVLARNHPSPPNDGVVNTRSMSGPKLGSRDHVSNSGDQAVTDAMAPGTWHYMGVLTGWEHLDIVGQQTHLDPRDFYLGVAELLASLPARRRPGSTESEP